MRLDRGNPGLIDRGDLLAALDRATASKVAIISAPAGSGKTSLLRAWADRTGQAHRLAVVQVQRDRQDAQTFWLALLGAVRLASGATGGTAPPAATPDFNAEAMVDRVLSALADARNDIALVIDDLHEVNPEALENPDVVNTEPYGSGWLLRIRIEDPRELDDLINEEEYAELTTEV